MKSSIPLFASVAPVEPRRDSPAAEFSKAASLDGSFHDQLTAAERKTPQQATAAKSKARAPSSASRAEVQRRGAGSESTLPLSGKPAAKGVRTLARHSNARRAVTDADDEKSAPSTPAYLCQSTPETRTASANALLEKLCGTLPQESETVKQVPEALPVVDSTSALATFVAANGPLASAPSPTRAESMTPSGGQRMEPSAGITLDSPPEGASAAAETDARSESLPLAAESETSVADRTPSDQTSDMNQHQPGEEPGQKERSLQPERSGIISAARGEESSPLDGIDVAKDRVSMNITVEIDESAGQTVNNLPSADTALELPASNVISRGDRIREAHDDRRMDFISSHGLTATTTSTGPAAAVEEAGPTAMVPAVEHVARAVQDGVAQIRQEAREAVSVVLKPDAATELHLRVEMRDGALSAQLHFERGDRSALDQHWDELQRRMAGQGVHLTRSDAGAGDPQFAHSQRHGFDRESELSTGLIESVTKKATGSQPTARRRAAGFETWA